jgi:hypothetical protein
MRLRQSVAGGTAVFPKGRITGVRESATGKAGITGALKAAHCPSVGETENTMSVFKNKRALALVLAIVMAMSVFAVSAYATSPVNSVNPGQNDLLWWADEDFTVGFVDSSGDGTYWGYDTLQIVDIDTSVNPYEFVFIIHPQYYHEPDPLGPNWEDPDNAIGVFAITDFKVWNPLASDNGEWVDGLVEGGTAVVPSSYLQFNDELDPYFLCELSGMYLDLTTDTYQTFTLENAYLQIP